MCRPTRAEERRIQNPTFATQWLALDQIPQQVRRHRQLGKRKATGRDLLDRAADAGRLRMGREPVPGGLLAGLAGCQHVCDQSSFRGRDLVNGAIDGETFEIIVCRNAACGGDDAIEVEIGLGGEKRRRGVADGPVGPLRDGYDIRCRDQGVEIGEFAGKLGRDAGYRSGPAAACCARPASPPAGSCRVRRRSRRIPGRSAR